MGKQLLFSIKKKDFIIETFRCGGKGGQNVNKVETGVRIRHLESGAVAEGREHRTQLANRKSAFSKLVKREEFKKWHRIKCSKILGDFIDEETYINEQMNVKNLRFEIKVDGKWKNISYDDLINIKYEELDD